MREVSLKNYKFVIAKLDGTKEDKEYNVRDALATILFVPGQGISPRESLSRNELARRIESCQADSILLEESEWDKLNSAAGTLKDVNRNDLECLQRIFDAPKVEVEKSGRPDSRQN